ncbi:MAG: hypothetical protein H8F28_09435 [Fibrella sp.]|nr:hypothetical protein [Armatimonadota bacterium]
MNTYTYKEPANSTTPEIAAIVLVPHTYKSIAQLMRHLRAQTVADRMEIVFVAPDVRELNPPDDEISCFAAVRAVSPGEPFRSSASARVPGVRAATAPVVALTEEHSLPEADWAANILAAYASGEWAAVGPGIVNANPDSAISWANFLLEYGQWSDPVPAGETEHLPGHNCTYRREMLLGYGDNLGTMLEAESLIHWDLRARGHRICMHPAARTRHWNYSVTWGWIPLRFLGGKLFAGYRSRQLGWPLGKRMMYLFGSPLIPLVRLRRIVAESNLPGRPQKAQLARIMPVLLFALVVDAMGEAAGYLAGPGRSQDQLATSEFNRRHELNARDQMREDAP